MTRTRAIATVAALAGLALVAVPAPAPGALTRAQKFFGNQLQRDRTVGAEVRTRLRDGSWRVDRDIVFADLTGDDKSDAVVRVNSGTAAGNVALYVFSSRGSRALRVVHRAEQLYRATVSTRGKLLRIVEPGFRPGDPTCCPSTYVERSYRWQRNRFVLRNKRTTRAEQPGAEQPGAEQPGAE